MTLLAPPVPRVHPDLVRLLGRVHRADAFEFLPRLPEESVHAIVTDPPFGIGFLGNLWDEFPDGPVGYQGWAKVWARACLRVLVPGGHLVAFGGNRTMHRMTAGLEDAGFEIRGLLGWIHAQGLPKQRGQLRPALEPIVLARKPFTGSAISTFGRHGTALLNVEASRIPFADVEDSRSGYWPGDHPDRPQGRPWYGRVGGGGHRNRQGRWPATALVTDGALGDRSRYFDLERWAEVAYVAKSRGHVRALGHPTVKPEPILAWLVSLVSWPGQVVLDPFAGTGTTVRAADNLSRLALGVERDAQYAAAYRTSRQRRRSQPSSALSSTSNARPKSSGRVS